MLVTTTLEGLTPLLMNRMSDADLEGLRVKARKAKTAPRPTEPREEAEPKVYRLPDGSPHIPVENIFACLVEAGRHVRLEGKRMVSTLDSTALPSFLSLVNTTIPLERTDDGHVAWEVDVRQGRNPNGGQAVCIVRPRFDKWAFRLTLDVDESEVGESLVRELVDKAGKRIGLGDFRPQRKGYFGRFHVVNWARG